MSFVQRLLSGDETGTDSVVVGGLTALMILCGVTVYAAVRDLATWSPANYGAAVVLILGAMAGGKTARDRWAASPGEPPKP